jgi:O-antigen ligase
MNMELAARPLPRARAIGDTVRVDGPALGAFALGFAPVLYLALRGGGYDTIVYSEVGLAAWWLVLLGALIRVMPLQRFKGTAWVTAGLFSAFVVWTLIASSWSSSAERTVADVGRLAAYVGFFVLGLCALRRDTIRPLVGGMAAAFGLVSLLAVLSRLYPGAFPTDQVAQVFAHGTSVRLSYPLNYASGDGNFIALGLPLLLAVSTRARSIAVQALATAAIPVTVLGLVMTASRGGVLTAIVGIAVFYALAPDRLPKIATGLVAAIGSSLLVVGVIDRHGVREGLSTPAAVSQRHELMLLVVLVCAGVALIQVAIGLAARYAARPPGLVVTRTRAIRLTVGALVVVIAVAVAAGVPGKLQHQWNVFKETSVTGIVSGNTLSRLGTLSGSHRYQYWVAAAHAFEHKPIAGIGPGTYEFYWDQHGSLYEFIRNAHSLYFETLAETGIVGFLPLMGFLLALLITGLVRALRAPPLARVSLAAATAMFAAFLVSAGYDWMWQLSCAPVAALLLGAAIVAYRDPPIDPHPAAHPRRRWVTRGILGIASVAALIVIAIPFAMTSAIRSSQSEAGSHDLKAALSDALTAQSLEPYAATPRLQEALIYEQAHDFGAARAAISQAAVREPLNWRIWLVRARIEAESGRAGQAVRDYKHAHVLDPLDPNLSE